MGIEKKNIDDKSFDDFFREGRDKIPSLSPDWTDHNLSDPGITLLELFSWLHELDLYKASVVTDKHIQKFAQIYGFGKLPAVSSVVWLNFAVKEGFEKRFLTRGSSIKTFSRGKLINFKTLNSAYINKSRIDNITFFNGGRYLSVPSEKISKGYYLFGTEAEEGSIFYIGFREIISGGITLGFIFDKDPLIKREKNRFIPDVKIQWSVLTSKGWKILNPKVDTTDCFYRSGIVTLKMPADLSLEKISIPVTSKEKFYFLRCKLLEGSYDNPPQLRYVSFNLVPAVQIDETAEKREIKGAYPEMEIRLSEKYLTEDEVSVYINGEKWKEVTDIKHYSHNDKVFQVDREKSLVKFGDGINGMLPSDNSVVIVRYRFCKGVQGNIQAGSNWETEEGLSAYNPFPGYGGKDPEREEDLFRRIKKEIYTPSICVTLKDYESIALQTPDVKIARAKAYTVRGKNQVKVYLLPASNKKEPVPSKAFLRHVCKHLNRRRLVTTKIDILPPKYIKISVAGKITVKDGFDSQTVKQNVLEKLDRYFHPVSGKDGEGWDFGDTVYISHVYSVVETVDGVDGVFQLNINPEDKFRKIDRGNVYLFEDFLPVSGSHSITLIDKTEACRSEK